MVGFARVAGTGKMRSLVAVLLVCSSVVSQPSATAVTALLRTRELLGNPQDLPTGSPVLQPSSSSRSSDALGAEFEASFLAPSGSKASTLAPETAALDTLTPAPEATVPDTLTPAPETPAPESLAPESTAPESLALESTAPAASTLTPMVSSFASSESMTESPFMLLQSQLAAPTEDNPSLAATTTSIDLTPDTELTVSSSGSAAAAGPTPVSLKKPTTAKTDSSSSSHVSSSASSSNKSDTSSSSDGLKSTKAKKGKGSTSDSGSGSDDYESGSGSMRTYACACKNVQKVSLMGQSDYCLAKSANVAYKCGNTAVKEKGECPRVGAQPCSDTGHVLASDSICAFDDVDSVYKCVASKEDLEIKKNGGKKKKKNSTLSNSTATDTIVKSDAAASLHRSTVFHAITLIATLALGIAALL